MYKKTPHLSGIIVFLVFLAGNFAVDSLCKDPYLPIRLVLIVPLVLILILSLYKKNKESKPWSSNFLYFLGVYLAFVIWIGLSSIWAINRQEVWQVWSKVVLFGLLLFAFYKWHHDFSLRLQPLLVGFLTLLGVISVIAIFQFHEIAFLDHMGQPKPAGLSGNRNLLGSYLVFLFPVCIYFLINKTSSITLRTSAGIIFVLAMYGIVLSQTRSAWLALFTQLILIEALGWKFRRNEIFNLRLLHGMTLFSLIGVITWFSLSDGSRPFKNEFKERLTIQNLWGHQDNVASSTVQERLITWEATLNMILQKPITGHGGGNWRIAFPKNGGGSSTTTLKEDKIRVRPHNTFLQIFAELGIVGIGLFLTQIVFIATAIVQLFKKQEHLLLSIVLLLFFTSVFIDMIFSFSTERIEHVLLLTFFSALLFSKSATSTSNKLNWQLNNRIYQPLFQNILPLAFAIGILLPIYAKWKYERVLLQMILLETNQQSNELLSLPSFKWNRLISIGPVADPLQLLIAKAFMTNKDFDAAFQAISEAIHYHPYNHRILNVAGLIYLKTGRYEQAHQSFSKAIRYSPSFEPAMINLIICELALEALNEAEQRLAQLPKPYTNSSLIRLEEELARAQAAKTKKEFYASEWYLGIEYIQQQLADQQREVDITPLIQLRKKVGNDCAFITEYMNTLKWITTYYSEERSASWKNRLSKKYSYITNQLCQQSNLDKTIHRLFTTNHYKTLAFIAKHQPQDFTDIHQIFAIVE